MMNIVRSKPGTSSASALKKAPAPERSEQAPEVRCFDVTHAGSPIPRSKGWRRLSLTLELTSRFRNVANFRKLEEVQQMDGPVSAAWISLLRPKSSSVSDIGALDNPHEVVMALQVRKGLPELSSKLDQSRPIHHLVEKLAQRQEAKVATLTRQAALRFVHSLLQRQQFKVAVLTMQATIRFVNGLQSRPKDWPWYNDPLTEEQMCDPVKGNDGRTYDRWTVICNRDSFRFSPYTRRPFEILVDDVDVRSVLFSEFPQQESQFHSKRADYRAKALQHPRSKPAEVEVAFEMLNNVLQWAPEDTQCQNELHEIYRHISCQSCQPLPDPLPIPRHRLPQGGHSQAPGVNRVAARSERSQVYVIPTITHEDFVRERYAEERLRCFLFLFAYMGLWVFLFESQRAW